MTHNKIKSIILGFENLETINIPVNNVATFLLEGVARRIFKSWHSEEIHESEVAESAVIALKPEADLVLQDAANTKQLMNATQVFARIKKYNDLTDITFIYNDDMERTISFQWDNEKDVTNAYQSSVVTNNGYLVVVIDKEKTAGQYAHEIFNY